MRRIQLATLLLAAVSLISSGCRQTTGPANTGAISPIGALSPVGQGQAPSLGPFGGPTRVTPPGTGAYVAPNNYMGGVAPIGQASGNVYPTGAYASQPSAGVIGSGVQVAGWSETNTVIQSPSANGSPAFGTNSTAGSNPRSGGMQVIDMTAAPAPPGYGHAGASSFPNQFPAAVQPNQNFQQGFQQGWQQGQQQPVPQQSFQNPLGLQPVDTPNPGEIANNLKPISQDFPPASQFQASPSRIDSVPRSATLPTQGPSTEPINSNNPSGSQSLPWRRPGTTY